MTVRTISTAITIAGAGALLTGCQGLNRSPQPGPHVLMDTLRPTADFYERVDKPLEHSGASLAGLSRDNWADTTFYVPVSGIEHKPTYTTDKPRRTDSTARQRGEYPSQRTVVEGSTEDSSGDQAVEALLAPVRAGFDIVMMIPKMVVTPPDRTVSSPRVGYERRPHPVAANNGGIRDGGLGVTLLELTPEAPPPPTTPAGEPAAPIDPNSPTAQAPAPAIVPPPPPPLPAAGPATPAPGIPSGAYGGSDSPRRREQNKPKEEKQ